MRRSVCKKCLWVTSFSKEHTYLHLHLHLVLTYSRTLGRVAKAQGLPWLCKSNPALPVYSPELSWAESKSAILCLIAGVHRGKQGLKLVGMDVRPFSLLRNPSQGRKKTRGQVYH